MHDAPPSPDAQAGPERSEGPDTPSWDELQAHLKRVQDAVSTCSQELTGFASEREAAEMHEAFLREQRRTLHEDREHLRDDRAALDERGGELEALRSRLDQRQAELEERAEQAQAVRTELRHRENTLNERRAKLDAQRKEFEERARQTIAELRAREQQHEAELEEKRRAFDQENEQRAERAREEHERQGAELEQRGRELEEGHHRRAAELEEREERRRAELERERESMREEIEHEAARWREQERCQRAELDGIAADLSERSTACEQREAQLAVSDERTERRRRRIGRYKAAIHQRARSLRGRYDNLEAVRSSAIEVLGQRGALAEVQRLLADAERRMIRRWSVGRAMSCTAGVVICAAVLLVISYAAAGQLATRRWVASAAVQHHGDPYRAAGAQQWAAAQKQRMLSAPVLREASVLMRQEGYAGPAQPAHLREIFTQGLHVASPRPGLLHAELHAAADPGTLSTLLASLTRAYAAEASTTEGEGGADITARVSQEAAVAPQPLEDNHLTLAAGIFGGSAAAALLLFFLARLYLLHTARGIAEEVGADASEDDERWRGYEDDLNRPARLDEVAAA